MTVICSLYIMMCGQPVGCPYNDPFVTTLAHMAIDGKFSPQDGNDDNDTTVIFCQSGHAAACPYAVFGWRHTATSARGNVVVVVGVGTD
jgi:hypothetical protein